MRWLEKINLAMAALIVLISLLLVTFWLFGIPRLETQELAPISKRIPRAAFLQSKEAYRAIGAPFLEVNLKPISVQVPDLRRHLQYLGRNRRPDIDPDKPRLRLGIRGGEDTLSVAPEEKVFLRYERGQKGGQYLFSEDGDETLLWISLEPTSGEREEVLIKVQMRDIEGNIISEPAKFSEFTLAEAKAGKSGAGKWTLGELRVDPSLLARMRARWFGQDQFIEVHGGEEYAFAIGKERIDFAEGEAAYMVFVGEGDSLIWKDGHWEAMSPGEESRQYPLMQVMKINGKLINLELWDTDGRSHVKLNLVHSRSAAVNQRSFKTLRFMGTKTRSQAILQLGNERMILNRFDWLLLSKEGWKLVDTLEEIDDFVQRRLRGDLFIFDEITRSEGRQVLKGHVFNNTRTDMQIVMLPLQTGDSVADPTFTTEEEETETTPSDAKIVPEKLPQEADENTEPAGEQKLPDTSSIKERKRHEMLRGR